MNSIKSALENLYSAFGRYTLHGIHHCDCGCIDESVVKKLYSKPLKELGIDDLAYYHGSALCTWGDIEHYKHFLPRILELYSFKRNYALVDLSEIYNKLEYAKWTEWEQNEIDALSDYILYDWIDFVNYNYSEIRDTELECYSRFITLERMIQLWKINESDEALHNFVLFFYSYGSKMFNNRFKTNGINHEKDVRNLINNKNLITRLENEFFKQENIDNEFAQKISIVIQMIEQESAFKR